MEHQDTMLTSMRPRLKELNDNPYLICPHCGKKIQVIAMGNQMRNVKLLRDCRLILSVVDA